MISLLSIVSLILLCNCNGYIISPSLIVKKSIISNRYYSQQPHNKNDDGGPQQRRKLTSSSSSSRHAAASDDNNDNNERTYYEKQRKETVETLERIDSVESKLTTNKKGGLQNGGYYANVVAVDNAADADDQEQQNNIIDTTDDNTMASSSSSTSSSSSMTEENNLTEISDEIDDIEKSVNRINKQYLLPPNGLTLDEYKAAIMYYRKLPFVIQEALCEAIEYHPKDESFLGRRDNLTAASDLYVVDLKPNDIYFNAPDIVSELHEKQYQLTQTKLQDLLKKSQNRQEKRSLITGFFFPPTTKSSSTADASLSSLNNITSADDKIFSNIDPKKDNAFDVMKKISSNIWNMDDDDFDTIDFDKLDEKTKSTIKDSLEQEQGRRTSSRSKEDDDRDDDDDGISNSVATRTRNILPRIITSKYDKGDTIFNRLSDKDKKDIDDNETILKNNVDLLVNDILLNKETPKNNIFVPTSRNNPYQKIPGGYMIRGTIANKTMSPSDLIDALDSKLPLNSATQVCYIKGNDIIDFDDTMMIDFDSTDTPLKDIFQKGMADGIDVSLDTPQDALLVTSNDFKPRSNPILLGTSTLISMASVMVFGISCFQSNDYVVKTMQDINNMLLEGSSSAGGSGGALGSQSAIAGFDLINSQIFDLIIPIVTIQIIHELAHYAIAYKDKIKVDFPSTLIPYWGISGFGFGLDKLILPYTASKTNLLSSPKDYSSLFDFAIAGPLAGLITSFIFLFVGLQTTISAAGTSGNELIQYYPNLSVDTIRHSTLIGTLVDTFYGQSGYITQSQSLDTNISVHPYVIAGYVGLMINSLEMLPLGSTDGGRISQCLFGRGGHVFVGAITWSVLLIKTFLPSFSSDPAAFDGTDILLTSWFVNNIIQNDMEIPCRNEIDPVPASKAIIAFFVLFLSILILVPL